MSSDTSRTLTLLTLAFAPASSPEFARRTGSSLIERISTAGLDAEFVIVASPEPNRRVIMGFGSVGDAVQAATSILSSDMASEGEAMPSAGLCLGDVDSSLPIEETLPGRKALALAAIAPPGQAILSTSTFEAVRDVPPPDVTFNDLGPVQIDQQFRRERVVQLAHPGMPSVPIHISTEDAVPKSLPNPYGLLIGRGVEIDDVYGRVKHSRLVSIVGAGGIGKSHLAQRVASELLESEGQEVLWVEMVGVNQAEHVVEAVAAAAGYRRVNHLPLKRMLFAQLAGRPVLIVLDGCDHCRSAVIEFLEEALAVGGPKFLVTTARRLGIPGESLARLDPLSLPPKDVLIEVETLDDYGGTALFMDRARMVSPKLDLTRADAVAVADICHQLGGNPLAIVLAARRVQSRSPVDILRGLRSVVGSTKSERLSTADARHRTLLIAMDWSYRSLSLEAQRQLRACFPFVGSWGRSEAAAMAEVGRPDVAGPIEELIDAGFVSVEGGVGPDERYRLQSQVSALIGKHFCSAEERLELLERHCLLMMNKLAEAAKHLSGPEEVEYLDRLEAWRPDLAAALAYTLRPGGQPRTFAEAVVISWKYWYKRNRIEEILSLVGRAVKRFSDPNDIDLGRMLNAAAVLATKSGLTQLTRKYLRRAIRIAERAGHTLLKAACLDNLANAQWADGYPEKAIPLYKQAESVLGEPQHRRFLLQVYTSWAMSLADLDRPEEAETVLARARVHLGEFSDHLDNWTVTLTTGQILLKKGHLLEAQRSFQAAANIAFSMGDEASLARTLAWMAEVLLREARPEMTARYLGAARAHGRLSGIQLYRVNEIRMARIEGQLRDKLADDDVTMAMLDGALLPLPELLELA